MATCFKLIFAAGLCLAYANASASQPMPLSDPNGNWQLDSQFSDEFDGSAVAQKWDENTPAWSPKWSWSPSNVAVADGTLRLTMKYDPSGPPHKRYVSGIIRSRNTILYGYFEARIKAPDRFPGTAAAFWASPSVKEDNLWTEVDFVEIAQHQEDLHEVNFNTHVFRYPTRIASRYPYRERRGWESPWDPRQDFHVYGCEWTASKITWYVDGQKRAERVNDYWHQPLNISLSLGLREPLASSFPDAPFDTTMQVDYIRVWTRK